jgi:hypothetical protein
MSDDIVNMDLDKKQPDPVEVMKAFTVLTLTKAFEDGVKDGSITVDTGNHNKGSDWLKERISGAGFSLFYSLATEVQERLLESVKSGKATEPIATGSSMLECCVCGKGIELVFDGVSITAKDECELPDGQPAFEFELNVPSGKMVAENDLRSLFPVMGSYDVNTDDGIRLTVEDYATLGLAHGFVGNTCPGIYKVDEGRFIVGHSSYPDEDEGGETEECEARTPEDGKDVGSICTDLWWYSICDHDNFKNLVARQGGEPESGQDVTVIDCKPGVYKFTHQFHRIDRDDYDNPQSYCIIDWARDPDPVVDLQAATQELDFTAGQVLGHNLGRSHFQGGTEIDNLMGAADFLMVCIGTGAEIHENGWVSDVKIPPDTEAVEIPVFDKPYPWYPMCEYSIAAALGGAKHPYDEGKNNIELNDSFTSLALNILRCMHLYGYPEEEYMGRTLRAGEAEQRVQSRRDALKYAKAIAKKWPEKVPEFCKDILKKKAEDEYSVVKVIYKASHYFRDPASGEREFKHSKNWAVRINVRTDKGNDFRMFINESVKQSLDDYIHENRTTYSDLSIGWDMTLELDSYEVVGIGNKNSRKLLKVW